MTDHSAIRARDPPLHRRLDPFYPQAPACGDLFATRVKLQARSRPRNAVFYIVNRLYPVIHEGSWALTARIASGSLRFPPESV
ncbi:hypothetical protein D4100_15755 [Serratia inhibens]|uniref:Uncharacterized protein n=1 Tax=Serratia inhibens TaxID=2338073 RepID=A0AA92X2Q7_9GAMM|nr:hypothetical protein D4100_15755 [Serratia inhibens]